MFGEAQDVLLAAETSLARHQNRSRRNVRRQTEEVPHCLTCCCLDNRQVPCSQRCGNSSKRHSARRNTTVDELLREMSFNETILSDDETYLNANNQVENEEEEEGEETSPSSPVPLACPSRTTRAASSYCEAAASKSHETTARTTTCERWRHVELSDNTSQIESAKSNNVERSERHSDGSGNVGGNGSKRKWQSDKKNSWRLQQQQLLGAGDRNVQAQQPAKVTTDADEEESSCENLAEEAHIRELKLVRWQFIERIHDEVTKLHRLQRHLDGCCSPPPPLPSLPTISRRRSVSTMTKSEPNVPGQF